MAIPRAKTDLDDYLSCGVCPKERRIFFGQPIGFSIEEEDRNNEFTQAAVDLAVRAIKRMEADHPAKPIEIYMNSYGGNFYAMLYLVDIIQRSSCQFKFFGGGAIMSSATWVLVCCDERYLYPNVRIMVHNGSEGAIDRYDDFHITASESKNHMETLIDLYTENSRMPRRFWQDVCKRDSYFSATEAVQLGMAEAILYPQKRGNLRKKRRAALAKHPSPNTMKKLVKKLYDRIDIGINLTDFSVHVPKEKEDSSLVVDNTPVSTEDEELIQNADSNAIPKDFPEKT